MYILNTIRVLSPWKDLHSQVREARGKAGHHTAQGRHRHIGYGYPHSNPVNWALVLLLL